MRAAEGIECRQCFTPFGDLDVPKGFVKNGDTIGVFASLRFRSEPALSLPKGERRVKVKRELEGGWFQWVELPLPALLTIQSGINKPRYATLKGIKGAKAKEIRRVTAAELGVDSTEASARNQLRRIYAPVKTKKTEFIEGPPKEAAAKLVEKLQREARVL